jgi:hypothetical protein
MKPFTCGRRFKRHPGHDRRVALVIGPLDAITTLSSARQATNKNAKYRLLLCPRIVRDFRLLVIYQLG